MQNGKGTMQHSNSLQEHVYKANLEAFADLQLSLQEEKQTLEL